MALVIETFLICDGHCGENYGVDMRHLSGYEHRKSAKEVGWIYTGNKDYCPKCRPKRKDGKPIKSFK